MNISDITRDNVEEFCQHIPTWTHHEEKKLFFDLGQELKDGDRFVGIGLLYGNCAAIYGIGAQNQAEMLLFDNFSFKPEGYPEPTKELLLSNLASVGVTYVNMVEADSHTIDYSDDDGPIALLWIDGGHEYEMCLADLRIFGPFAKTIALHDYDEPYWPGIHQAVDTWLSEHPEFYLDKVVEYTAVLRRKE